MEWRLRQNTHTCRVTAQVLREDAVRQSEHVVYDRTVMAHRSVYGGLLTVLSTSLPHRAGALHTVASDRRPHSLPPPQTTPADASCVSPCSYANARGPPCEVLAREKARAQSSRRSTVSVVPVGKQRDSTSYGPADSHASTGHTLTHIENSHGTLGLTKMQADSDHDP
eukprot:6173474-Pleurochrysis_carterae.AAC.3